MLDEPYPELDDLLTMMGEAGRHLAEIEASEGAAGNISICLRWPVELRTRFPVISEIDLPQPVPELTGATFLVSGSGRRLREIKDEPTANIACLVVDEGGLTARLYTAYNRRFERVTGSAECDFHAILSSPELFRTFFHP
jgi:rhamnulose-1-phosphate aldolase